MKVRDSHTKRLRTTVSKRSRLLHKQMSIVIQTNLYGKGPSIGVRKCMSTLYVLLKTPKNAVWCWRVVQRSISKRKWNAIKFTSSDILFLSMCCSWVRCRLLRTNPSNAVVKSTLRWFHPKMSLFGSFRATYTRWELDVWNNGRERVVVVRKSW